MEVASKAWAALRGRFDRAADEHSPLCHFLVFARAEEQSFLLRDDIPPLVGPPEGHVGEWVQGTPDWPQRHRVVGPSHLRIAACGEVQATRVCHTGRYYWRGDPPAPGAPEPTKALARWQSLATAASAVLAAQLDKGDVELPHDPLIDPTWCADLCEERWLLTLHLLAARQQHAPLRADRVAPIPGGFQSADACVLASGGCSFLSPDVFLASVYAIDALMADADMSAAKRATGKLGSDEEDQRQAPISPELTALARKVRLCVKKAAEALAAAGNAHPRLIPEAGKPPSFQTWQWCCEHEYPKGKAPKYQTFCRYIRDYYHDPGKSRTIRAAPTRSIRPAKELSRR